jgi:hypothetical protein
VFNITNNIVQSSFSWMTDRASKSSQQSNKVATIALIVFGLMVVWYVFKQVEFSSEEKESDQPVSNPSVSKKRVTIHPEAEKSHERKQAAEKAPKVSPFIQSLQNQLQNKEEAKTPPPQVYHRAPIVQPKASPNLIKSPQQDKLKPPPVGTPTQQPVTPSQQPVTPSQQPSTPAQKPAAPIFLTPLATPMKEESSALRQGKYYHKPGRPSKPTHFQGGLYWIQDICEEQKVIPPQGFSQNCQAWKDPLVIAAVIHYFRSDLIHLESIRSGNSQENFKTVWAAMQKALDQEPVLDWEDLVLMAEANHMDKLSMTTFIFQLRNQFCKSS